MPRRNNRGLNKNTMDKLHYYLNTGLKVQIKSEYKDYGTQELTIGNLELCDGKTYKPLMRPLSSLTKPITVEGYNAGEPFVPLQEMAKIVMDGIIVINQYTEWLDVSSCNRMEIVTNVLGQDYYLAYDLVKESFVFGIATNRKYQTFSPKGQLSLFTLMFSWGIWLFDQTLFDKSLIEIKD